VKNIYDVQSFPFESFEDVKHCRLVVQRQRKQKGEQLDLFDGEYTYVRQNRHKQGLNQTLEKISADFRLKELSYYHELYELYKLLVREQIIIRVNSYNSW